MKKIDISKIRGYYQETTFIDGNPNSPFVSAGDDTIESIKICAKKINEIVDELNAIIPEQD